MTFRKSLPTEALGCDYEELWRIETVEARIGLGRTAIYELMAAGDFPQARKISRRSVAWLMTEVREWMRTRPVASAHPSTTPAE